MDGLGHLDDSERPCSRHLLDLDTLLYFAALGTRTSSFNHDIASKLQGLMMTIDEVTELTVSPELKLAAETAHTAVAELNQLLQQNRALTKPPVVTRTSLHELVAKAAMRVGVMLRGARLTAEVEVEVAVPLVTQAIALSIDAAAGLERRRSIELATRVEDGRVELTLPIVAGAAPTGESLAIAAWIVARDRGELRCGERTIVIRLPVV